MNTQWGPEVCLGYITHLERRRRTIVLLWQPGRVHRGLDAATRL